MKYILITILLLGHAFSLAEERRRDYWNIQETSEHIYRVIKIGYHSWTDNDEVFFYSLKPNLFGLTNPQTRKECRKDTRDSVQNMYVDYYNASIPNPAVNAGSVTNESMNILLGDQNAGILGDNRTNEKNSGYSFMRFICLPMDLVDDLDLVGTEYESARDPVMPEDDPRHSIRYDADRFFARFEKYGVTRTLPVPDIKEGEHALHWDNDKWGTKIFIFPLDQSNE